MKIKHQNPIPLCSPLGKCLMACPTQRAVGRGISGFTLIEVLVSLAIFATLALSISQVTGNVFENKNKIELRANTSHILSVTLSKIFDDINMAFLADSTFQGEDGNYKTGFKGDQTHLEFSTMNHIHYVKNQRDSDQVDVGYSLRRNQKTDEDDLYRRETDYLMPDLDKGGQSFPILDHVKSLEFSYYDANQKIWKSEWDTDSVAFAGALPSLVKVNFNIYLEPPREDSQERREAAYELLVPIELYNQKLSFK